MSNSAQYTRVHSLPNKIDNWNPEEGEDLEVLKHGNMKNSEVSTDSSQEDVPDNYIHNGVIQYSKLKSQLCKTFAQYGYCPYEERCTFAHGPEELRQNQNPNILYKTKRCFAFFGGGFCKYGDRCNYLHIRPIEQQAKTEEYNRRKWRQILRNNRQIVYEARPTSRLLRLI